MNNKMLQDAVERYERSRQQVAILTDQRAKLLVLCMNEKAGLSPPYETNGFCPKVAKDDLDELIRDNPTEAEDYNYEEVLEANHDNGTCCQNCWDAYEIKTGPLAKARHDFGNAKRSLSRLGKILMKKKPL